MRALATGLLLFIGVFVQAAEPPKSPLSPEESLKHLVLADPNLVIEIVAAEPEVIDPVAIQFDEHGHLWVVELSDYPNGPEPGKPPLSRIKKLEDKDGDGRYETAHIFADKLLFATGVQPWDGGVIVTLAGEVAYFKDTDGDHKADLRETWFTGFAQANPQLRANHPTFGPDGWIYVANGLRGGNVIAVKKDWPVKVERSEKDKAQSPSSPPHPVTPSPPQSVSHNPANPVPVSLTGRDFKFDPLTGRYEAISGNGQFGMTFDAWGNRFVCDNRHPCRHVIFEEDFIKRCPHVAFPAVVHDVIPADDKNRVFPLTSAWTTSNLHAGTFTASCGVTVYTGDWLPEEFRGNVFVCEPTGNLVQRAILEPDGVTFKSRNPYQRAEVSGKALAAGQTGPATPTRDSTPPAASAVPLTNGTQEFLASRDDWFRPVDLQNGPDGALYVVDMYRAVIEHPEWVPDELKKRPDTWLGNDKGRIYRITRRGPKDTRPALSQLREKPISFLKDYSQEYKTSGWYQTTASRLVHEQLGREGGTSSVKSQLAEIEQVALSEIEQRGVTTSLIAEKCSPFWRSPRLYEFLGPFAALTAPEHTPLILKRLTTIALDESADQNARNLAALSAVQIILRPYEENRGVEPDNDLMTLQVIQSWHLLAPPHELRGYFISTYEFIAKLVAMRRFRDEPWIRQATIASEGGRSAQFLMELLLHGAHRFDTGDSRGGGDEEAKEETSDVWRGHAELFFSLGELAGKNGTVGDLYNLIPFLWQDTEEGRHSFQVLASGLLGVAKGLSRRRDELNVPLSSVIPEHDQHWKKLGARAILEIEKVHRTAPRSSLPRRQIAIRLLAHLNDQASFQYLKRLAENESDQEIRLTAFEAFASMRRPDVDDWLVERYSTETPAVRRIILSALMSSSNGQLWLANSVDTGKIAAAEIDAMRLNQLAKSKDEYVSGVAKKILAAAAPASRREVLDAYQPALTLKADPKRGRELFVKNCSTCHRVDNVGVNVAPDISDTRTKKPEQLLLDILDPNKAIDANYFAYAVVTKEGKTESGVISSETATSITLKQPEGKVLTLLRTDIDELRNTGLSLMPVGLEKNLDQQAVADLVFWLKNWRYLDGKVPATSLK